MPATLLADLVRDQTEDDEARSLLGQSWTVSGEALARLGRYDEAVAAYREALRHHRAAFERAPRVVKFREALSEALGHLAESLLALRRPAEAAAAAREILTLRPRDAGELYGVARTFASCASLARPDGPPGRRPDAGRRAYLDAAMKVLRQAVDAGFRDARRLTEDVALDPLRHRADFQAIVMDLAFPSDPFR